VRFVPGVSECLGAIGFRLMPRLRGQESSNSKRLCFAEYHFMSNNVKDD
jgi:hypothetical protein